MWAKKPKLVYYVENFAKYLYPKFLCRLARKRILRGVEQRPDYAYIVDRVNYYNKVQTDFSIGNEGIAVGDFTFSKKIKSTYFFDTYEYMRFFSPESRFSFVFGDVREVPTIPSIVKSRPIEGDNTNSILLNLDKHRHFVFVKDSIPFEKKDNKIIFYAAMSNRPHRIDFMEKYFGHPQCMCGDVSYHETIPREWFVKKISLKQHLTHKFVLALEGFDVATNLKWVMSSNCLAVMPKPKYETWFMEGRLIPNYHYVEIKDDYSDLQERMDYYAQNPTEAHKIIKNANNYIAQFQDKKREDIIALLVLQKYFEKSI
jgi:hypothetical protein